MQVILLSLAEELSGRLVKLFIDNQNVVLIACKGSMVDELHQLAMSIFGVCVKHGILLEVQWIPRNYNDCADSYSRISDKDDQIIYSDILKKFGVRILLMCSQIVKIIRSTDFIQNIGIQVQQVWMLLHMTGLEKIVG